MDSSASDLLATPPELALVLLVAGALILAAALLIDFIR